jgi:peptidoglycan hydrolase-like protein with peptidoglycan-binding domain
MKPVMAEAIQSSVGVSGANRAQDVGIVQHLLNVTRTKVGIPKERLEVDGLFGPLTLAAIREFQTKFCKLVDGKLVPNGETITKLNQVGGPISRLNNGVAFLTPSGPRRTRDA